VSRRFVILNDYARCLIFVEHPQDSQYSQKFSSFKSMMATILQDVYILFIEVVWHL